MSDSPRPNYVKFEVRAVEDRTRSIEEGHFVPKDVIFAIVTPAGTKDRLEKPADEWIESIEEGIKQERIPAEWGPAYRKALQNFKDGLELPEHGTPITNWPAISPAQTRVLLDINVRTIEDVAEMNEETLNRLGMGGRALKEKARAWLDSSEDTGKVAAEVEGLRQANIALEERNASLEERLAKLEKQLQKEKPAKTEA